MNANGITLKGAFMNTRIISSLFGSLLFVIFLASGASGQAQRTFISGLGNDGNPCTRTAPCRTFGQAILGTNAGGEVIVLDSAGYGPFAINKSISIIASPGAYAGISVFSGDGIDIVAGTLDTVILRGLTVNNQGSQGNGIRFVTGGRLHIETCVVSGFAATGNAGVRCDGTAGKLEMMDSIVRGNSIGISIQGASALLDQVRMEANVFEGLFAGDGAKVTVRNSVASHNGAGGFFAISEFMGGAAELTIESCVASNNGGAGIRAESISTGVATVRVSNSTITDNVVGLENVGSPATLLSLGNNIVEGNGTNTSGTIGSFTGK